MTYFFLVISFCTFLNQPLRADDLVTELAAVTTDSRCPVCGMFVHKYGPWITQIRLSDGTVVSFDGVKDMAAYWFAPQTFGAPEGVQVADMVVKDYYTLQWLDGKKVYYVQGSDVLGPMGHELIPLSSQEAADNFLKDHHGSRVLTFNDIKPSLIDSLRQGHTMKGHAMPGMK